MRIPTFSRQSDTTTDTTATDDRARVAARTDTPSGAPARPDHVPAAHAEADRTARVESPTARNTTRADLPAAQNAERRDERSEDNERTVPIPVVDDRAKPDRTRPGHVSTDLTPPPAAPRTTTEPPPVIAGPKPRASLLATLALITGVASALLVLSGPLAGYGIGVAGLSLVLAVAGIRATGRRHVAGKTDALIGLALALGAIVVGILALTGSLSWLGTDMQPATDLRQWLDSEFANRF